MKLLKGQPIFGLLNFYMVDSSQPANIFYLWDFRSLLRMCLVIQIFTGFFLAMHQCPSVTMALVSMGQLIERCELHWLVRNTHANIALFFFICLYFHVARGLYYGSHRNFRVLLWSIGVTILIVMMAQLGPNCNFELLYLLNL